MSIIPKSRQTGHLLRIESAVLEIAGHVVRPAREPVEELRQIAVAPALGVLVEIEPQLLDEGNEVLARVDVLDLLVRCHVSRPGRDHPSRAS